MKKNLALIVVMVLSVFLLNSLFAQEVQRRGRTAVKPVTKTEASSEKKEEAKADAKPEEKKDEKSDAKQETKPEAKPDANAQPGQETKPGTQAPPPQEVKPNTPPAPSQEVKPNTPPPPPQEVKPNTPPAQPQDARPEAKAQQTPRPASALSKPPKAEGKPEAKAEPKQVPVAVTAEKDDDEEGEDEGDDDCSVLEVEKKFDATLKDAGMGPAFTDFFSRGAVVVSSSVMDGRPWASGLDSDVAVSFKPFAVKVSSSCDLGYVVGDWEETRKGKVVTGGQYVNVWKKVKREWKILAHAKSVIPRGYKAEKRPSFEEVNSEYERKGGSQGSVSAAEKQLFGALKQGGWAKAYDALAGEDIMKIRRNSQLMRGKKQVFLRSVVERGFLVGETMETRTSRSDDISVVWGGAEAKGPQPYQKGSFLHVWTRDGEGAWKLAVDFLMLGGNELKKSIL